MDIEQGLKTQKLRLLRLLAGLSAVVGFLSSLPLAPLWSEQVRRFLGSVLSRTEAASQSLVFVQACVVAKARGGDGACLTVSRDAGMLALSSEFEEAPSFRALARRLRALRYRLVHLPRCGERLLRRSLRRASGLLSEKNAYANCGFARVDSPSTNQWHAPVLWHPPKATAASF